MDLDFLFQNSILDSVTYTAAARYNPSDIARLGLRLETNTTKNKVFSIGKNNPPVYPNVAIWKPDYTGSSIGKTIVAECIETEKTFDSIASLNRLFFIASTPIILNIIVPVSYATIAGSILTERKIRYDNLFTFYHNSGSNVFIIEQFKGQISS